MLQTARKPRFVWFAVEESGRTQSFRAGAGHKFQIRRYASLLPVLSLTLPVYSHFRCTHTSGVLTNKGEGRDEEEHPEPAEPLVERRGERRPQRTRDRLRYGAENTLHFSPDSV